MASRMGGTRLAADEVYEFLEPEQFVVTDSERRLRSTETLGDIVGDTGVFTRLTVLGDSDPIKMRVLKETGTELLYCNTLVGEVGVLGNFIATQMETESLLISGLYDQDVNYGASAFKIRRYGIPLVELFVENVGTSEFYHTNVRSVWSDEAGENVVRLGMGIPEIAYSNVNGYESTLLRLSNLTASPTGGTKSSILMYQNSIENSLGIDNTGGWYVTPGGSGANNAFYPTATNTTSLGKTGQRWTTVYLQSSPVVTSDFRTKEDIKPLKEGCLNLVKNLKPVAYKIKERNDDTTHFGFIAQEVEETMRDHRQPKNGLIITDHDGLKSMAYEELVPILTKALQQLTKRHELLQEENNKMSRDHFSLQAKLDVMEKKLGTFFDSWKILMSQK